MKLRLIRIVTFLGGVYFFLRFVLPADIGGFEFARYNTEITNGFRAIGALAFGLGIINILLVHGSRLAFVRKGWFPSLSLLFGLIFMVSVTIWDWRSSAIAVADADQISTLREFATAIERDIRDASSPIPPTQRVEMLAQHSNTEIFRIEARIQEISSTAGVEIQTPAMTTLIAELNDKLSHLRQTISELQAAQMDQVDGTQYLTALPQVSKALGDFGSGYRSLLVELNTASLSAKLYRFMTHGLFIALGTAMFSLLAFYIASAAYRAFRIRSAESALMMTAAVVVMLGQIPFGIWLWDGFPELRLWLLTTPSAAARRAIEIGAAVAGLIMAFRMWFSIESESFAKEKL